MTLKSLKRNVFSEDKKWHSHCWTASLLFTEKQNSSQHNSVLLSNLKHPLPVIENVERKTFSKKSLSLWKWKQNTGQPIRRDAYFHSMFSIEKHLGPENI